MFVFFLSSNLILNKYLSRIKISVQVLNSYVIVWHLFLSTEDEIITAEQRQVIMICYVQLLLINNRDHQLTYDMLPTGRRIQQRSRQAPYCLHHVVVNAHTLPLKCMCRAKEKKHTWLLKQTHKCNAHTVLSPPRTQPYMNYLCMWRGRWRACSLKSVH